MRAHRWPYVYLGTSSNTELAPQINARGVGCLVDGGGEIGRERMEKNKIRSPSNLTYRDFQEMGKNFLNQTLKVPTTKQNDRSDYIKI